MKKGLLVVVVLLSLLLGAVAAPVLAAPQADLTALAEYFPTDAPLFLALRTDDTFIQELDTLLAGIAAKLPPGVIPPEFSLTAALDQVATEIGAEDFATGIRSWLGDYAAFGSLGDVSQEQFLIAVQITDRATAETFWMKIINQNPSTPYELENKGDYSLVLMNGDNPAGGGLLLTDDLMLFGVGDLEKLLAKDGTLARNPAFMQAVSQLPADAYSGLVYLDLPALALAGGNLPPNEEAVQALGTMLIGLTTLDERTLVMDVVSTGTTTALADLGFTVPEFAPVNPAFLANLPADTSMVVQANNLSSLYTMLVDAARIAAAQATDGSSPEDVDKGLEQIKFAVQGLLGLDLEADILDWMTGDFAAFVTVNNDAIQLALQQGMEGQPVAFETLPFGVGVVIEATDATKAQTLATALGEALPKLPQDDPSVTISQEEIGGVAVTVLSSPIEVFSGKNVPLDVVIGANDTVFVIATRAAATAILTGAASGGLTTVPAFVEAETYLLANPTSIWYMDSTGFSAVTTVVGLAMVGPAVGQVFDTIVADLESGAVSTLTPEEQKQRDEERQRQLQAQMQAQMQQAQGLIAFLNNFLSSATISTTTVDGGALSRFVLTLAK